MNDYQIEQRDALDIVREGLVRIGEHDRRRLGRRIACYLAFRRTVDRFLDHHFSDICTRTCYTSRTSACCSRDGIITFFADTVVNALVATPAQLDRLAQVLTRENNGHRCIYLSDHGCLWAMRPVVCAMFLCDRSMETVFGPSPRLRDEWRDLRQEERRFKWPDRPVLFDELEQVFLDLGYRSSLMHLNFSPGLLHVKRLAGVATRRTPR